MPDRRPTARRHGAALVALLAAVLLALAAVGRGHIDTTDEIRPTTPPEVASSSPSASSNDVPGDRRPRTDDCCGGDGCCVEATEPRGYVVAVRAPGRPDRFRTVGLGDEPISAWTPFEIDGLAELLRTEAVDLAGLRQTRPGGGAQGRDVTSVSDLLTLLANDRGLGPISRPDLYAVRSLAGVSVVIRSVGHQAGSATLVELASRLLDPAAQPQV
ncbi:MAG TPA: hypothetical protein VIY72_12305 [Acidimicrobiales bacterium]